ncbi:hypothetical protein SAMN05443144_14711 [Fodinibius roseus]|uniref:Uncharacterized protein n=1 Tax=Fodinibius roseus TaxID=1194090 RepID=A0A1M5M024_9BACT|nr:hypothetical protein SAMN05443144_14711 [Fodinibius roseus]
MATLAPRDILLSGLEMLLYLRHILTNRNEKQYQQLNVLKGILLLIF